MRSHLLRAALSAEIAAILLSQHATPQAKVLWLAVAAVVYWYIARGSRLVHAFQFVAALLGVVVTAIAGGWPALAYAVETGTLAAVWLHGSTERGHRDT